jgi:hypothetical protein
MKQRGKTFREEEATAESTVRWRCFVTALCSEGNLNDLTG